jgi:ubiquinone/menaquinone biosynthesis C-methylase UbiE
MTTGNEIKQEVRKRYGAAAKKAAASQATSCCGDGEASEDLMASSLDATDELQHLPQEAVIASLGCGNPVAVAALKEGETVLDLGSGGGIDVLLSARRVGPQGKAYGLDMTDEMLDLAHANASKAGVANVEFVKGEIEDMPLPDGEVDVIISNCVVNLSPDKDRVLSEAFRVLKPGGRIAIADIVTHDDLPDEIKQSMAAWTGCIAGALTDAEYRDKLAIAGFQDVDIESFREYTASDAGRDSNSAGGLGIFSAVVRARKPGGDPAAGRNWEPIAVVAGDKPQNSSCC